MAGCATTVVAETNAIITVAIARRSIVLSPGGQSSSGIGLSMKPWLTKRVSQASNLLIVRERWTTLGS